MTSQARGPVAVLLAGNGVAAAVGGCAHALVSLAYAFCLGVGAAAHGGRQPIARKNHGYRAASLSRHGLNLLRQLARPLTLPEDPLARLVETLLNWITRQLAKNQLLKIVG